MELLDKEKKNFNINLIFKRIERNSGIKRGNL